jgi:hypothetical protein
LQEALELTKEYMPLERRLRQAQKEGLIHSDYLGLQIGEAEKAQVISKAEARSLREYHDKVSALLAVDDFSAEELARVPADQAGSPPPKEAPRKKATRKKSAPAKRVASKKAGSKKKIKQT